MKKAGKNQKSEVRGQKAGEKISTQRSPSEDAKGAELLPVKAEKAIDTLQARTIATWALGHHDGTRAGAMFMLASAIACGIQLVKAKTTLQSGDFLKWQKKYLGSFSARTAQRYMKIIDQLRARGKYDTVSHLLDIAPEKMSFEYGRQVTLKIQKVVEASTMKELLQDEGVIKPPNSSDHEYQDRKARVEAKNPGSDEEKQMLFAEEFWGDVEHSIKKFALFFDDGLKNEDVKMKTREKAVARLSELIEQLTGAKVELKFE